MGTTFVVPTSINDNADPTGLGVVSFHPYTKQHFAVPAFADRGAWSAAAAYTTNDVVSNTQTVIGAQQIPTTIVVKYVCIAANTNVVPAFSSVALAKWLPLLNSGTPVYFPGHANYVQVAVPLMSQLQDIDESLTQLAWPDISGAFLWWLAYGWAPGDSANKHTIVDNETTRSGSIGNRNTIQLRGPNLRYSFDWYGLRWGLDKDFRTTDEFGVNRLDWPIVTQFCIHDLDFDPNRSRAIENDSRWAEPAAARLRANVTSFREYAEKGVIGARQAKYRVEQIAPLDRLRKPIAADAAWGQTISPGGQPITSLQAEYEIIATHVKDTGTYRGLWATGTTYAAGERVTATVTLPSSNVTTMDFVSLADGNVGRTPNPLGSIWWRVTNNQLHLDKVYLLFNSEKPLNRYPIVGTTDGTSVINYVSRVPNPDWIGLNLQGGALSPTAFTGNTTLGSPIVTNLTALPIAAWVGQRVTGIGLISTTVYRVLSIDTTPGNYKVTLDANASGAGTNIPRALNLETATITFPILSIDVSDPTNYRMTVQNPSAAGSNIVRDLTLPYLPVFPTRALEGRTVDGKRPDLLILNPLSAVGLYEPGAFIRSYNPTTRVATIASDNPITQIHGDLPPSTSATPLVVQHLDVTPLPQWVGKQVTGTVAGLGNPPVTITAVDASDPANMTMTMSKPAGPSVTATRVGYTFNLLYSDGPINATLNGFGGFGLNYVVSNSVFTAGRVGVVDPTAFTGNTTLGSPIVTNLTALPIAAWVGQVVTGAGLDPLTVYRVLSIDTTPGNYKVTLDANASGAGTNIPRALTVAAGHAFALYDPTPTVADDPPYSRMTVPYFEAIASITTAVNSDVVTANYPTWVAATPYGIPNIVVSGGTIWAATATSVGVTPGTDATKWVAATLNGWVGGTVETFADPIFGARPNVAKVLAVLSPTTVRVDRQAQVATTAVYAIRAAVLQQAVDVVLPTQFPFKANGVQLVSINSPGNRSIPYSPRDPYVAGITPFYPRAVLEPGTNIVRLVEARLGNGWVPWHPGSSPALWWSGVNPAWANVRGLSDALSMIPWNAKITAVDLSNPADVRITLDKTIGAYPGSVYRGTWNTSTVYAVDDMVKDGTTGKLYNAIQAGANHPVTTAAYWTPISPVLIYVDDQPRTKITQRCRFHDSTCTTDSGLDTAAGGFEMSNGRNGIFYDAYTQLPAPDGSGSVFFNWHSFQFKGCADIEVDHLANIWTWADTWFFTGSSFDGITQHDAASRASMQCEDITIHDVYTEGTGRQHLTLQANAGLNYYRNRASHLHRLYGDNESPGFFAAAHALLIGVRIAECEVQCDGADILMTNQTGFSFSLPPKKLTNVQLVNGSKTVRIQPASLTSTNSVDGRQQGCTVDIWAGTSGTLPPRTYFKKMLGWDAIELSAPYTGADAVAELMLHDSALARDWTLEDCRLMSGTAGANFDGYISKGSQQHYSSVAVMFETVANSTIARVASYVPRDDSTSYTLDPSWLQKRINPQSPRWNANTLITEIGPNGTDLPTAAHVRLSKVAKETHPESTLGLVGLLPCPWPDWKFLRNYSTSPMLFDGTTGGQAGRPPMWMFGRFCDYVQIIDNVYPGPGATTRYVGWRDIGIPTYKFLNVDGPPPGFTHWTKTGNYFYGSPDNDFTPVTTLAASIAFNSNPHASTDPLVITVTMTPSDGQAVSGHVLIFTAFDPAETKFDANNLWDTVPIVGNVAVSTKPSPPPGTRYVSVRYNGGRTPKYPYLFQGPVTLAVDTTLPTTPTSTALVASPASPQNAGMAEALTATVSPNPGAGTVTFSDGTTVIGTAAINASGVATLNVPTGFTAGTHPLTAQFGGSGNFQSSTSPVLNFVAGTAAGPVVNYQNPLPDATGVSPSSGVQFSFDKPTQNVAFNLKRASDMSTVAGSLTVGFGVYSFTPTAPLLQNTVYLATVTAAQDQSVPPNSMTGPVAWQFTTGGAGLVISATPNPGSALPAPAPIIAATLTMPDGSTPPGRVDFFLNGFPFGSALMPGSFPNRCTFQPAPIDAGDYTVTAHYSGQSAGTAELWSQQSHGSGLLSNALIDQMVTDKASGIRLTLDFSSIYPTKTSYTNDAPQYPSFIAYAKSKGLKILATITYSPDGSTWAGDFSGYHQVPRTFGAVAIWAEMARRAVRDVGTQIDAWEVWNEPNNKFFNTNPDTASYRLFLRSVVLAMRSQDPNAVIMNGGPSSTASIPSEWKPRWDTGTPNSVNNAGISQASALDGLFHPTLGIVPGTTPGTAWLSAYAIHAYTDGQPYPTALLFENCFSHVGIRMPGVGDPAVFPNGFAFWDDIICPREGYADPQNPPPGAKQIWQTEAGLRSFGTYFGETSTEFRQASDAALTFQHWRTYPFAGPYVWFHHRNNPGSGDASDAFAGLYRDDNTPKPARDTFKLYAAAGGGSTNVPPVDAAPYALTIGTSVRYYGGKTTPG